MGNSEFWRTVLCRVVGDHSWIPTRGSGEEEAVLEMAEMGWLVADPERPSGIGVTDRGMDRYHQWGGKLVS